MEKLNSVERYRKLVNEGKHIFMFSADWCPDCRFIDPILPDVEKQFSEFSFIYVDRDQFIDLCGELGIFGIPSFIAFKEGNEIGRFVSKNRKTKEEIENFIKGLK
jgi:thiol-disulfide isomerase/thioredoxin